MCYNEIYILFVAINCTSCHTSEIKTSVIIFHGIRLIISMQLPFSKWTIIVVFKFPLKSEMKFVGKLRFSASLKCEELKNDTSNHWNHSWNNFLENVIPQDEYLYSGIFTTSENNVILK